MLRSFHYAVYSAFLQHVSIRPESAAALLEPWTDPWYHFVGGVFLNSYLKTVAEATCTLKEKEEQEILLYVFLLDKATCELTYELNNHSDRVLIPIRGIRLLMKDSS